MNAITSIEERLHKAISLSSDAAEINTAYDTFKSLEEELKKEDITNSDVLNLLSVLYSNMAYVNRQQSKRKDALELLSKARYYAKDNFSVARCFEELGLVYRLLEPKESDSAVVVLIEAIDRYSCSDNKEAEARKARVHGILGNVYLERNINDDLDLAMVHLQKDYEYQTIHGTEYRKGNSIHGLLRACNKKHDYQNALDYAKEVLEIYRRIGFKRGVVNILIEKAETEIGLGSVDQAKNSIGYALEHIDDFFKGDLVFRREQIEKIAKALNVEKLNLIVQQLYS